MNIEYMHFKSFLCIYSLLSYAQIILNVMSCRSRDSNCDLAFVSAMYFIDLELKILVCLAFSSMVIDLCLWLRVYV